MRKEIINIEILKTSRARNSDRKTIQPIKIGSGCHENEEMESFQHPFQMKDTEYLANFQVVTTWMVLVQKLFLAVQLTA